MATPFVIPIPKPGPYTLTPDSQRQPGVPKGTVTKHEWRSAIFPGTLRSYWVYVPTQYQAGQAANVMVFQDGGGYASEDGTVRAPVVFDNLIHQGKLPVTIGIFIDPGHFPAVGTIPLISNRSFEYDTLSDQYARFLLEEILPEVGKSYTLTTDPAGRGICGSSSGGICSFTVAWQRPEAFRKVYSLVGSFADIRGGHVYPTLVRKTPPKPIRVYLQAAANDLDRDWGNWALASLEMASAFNYAGYDYHLEYGDGAHDTIHGGVLLPAALQWLWR